MVYKCYILPIGRMYRVHQNLPRIRFKSSSEIGIVHRSSPAQNFGHLFMLNLNLLVGGDVDVHCHAGRIDFFAILKSHRIQRGKGHVSLPIFISPVLAIQRSRKGELILRLWETSDLPCSELFFEKCKQNCQKNVLKVGIFLNAGDFPIRGIPESPPKCKRGKFAQIFWEESFLFTSGCPWKWS